MSDKDIGTDFEKSILEIMNEYKDAVYEDVKKSVDTVTKQAVSKLHSANPAGSGEYGSWNDYNKGWKAQKEKGSKSVYKKVIHNSTHYRLAHLLEHGHALKNGGRARAFPHIAPVEEEAEEQFMQELQKNIEANK